MIGLGLGLQYPRGLIGGGKEPYLLDEFSGAIGGYSLRQLVENATDCITVRRSSDSLNQTFGFVNRILDVDALVSFVGINSAFYAIVHNQIDATKNAIQTTASLQPKIILNGVVQLENGKPTILFEFDATEDSLFTPRLITSNEWYINAVVRPNNVSGFKSIVAQHTGLATTGRTAFMQMNGSDYELFFNNGTSRSGTHSTPLTTNQTLLGSFATNNNYSLSVNGVLEEVITGQAHTPLDTDFTISGLENGNNPFIGNMQEIIVWNSNQLPNRVAIENNINNFYGIY